MEIYWTILVLDYFGYTIRNQVGAKLKILVVVHPLKKTSSQVELFNISKRQTPHPSKRKWEGWRFEIHHPGRIRFVRLLGLFLISTAEVRFVWFWFHSSGHFHLLFARSRWKIGIGLFVSSSIRHSFHQGRKDSFYEVSFVIRRRVACAGLHTFMRIKKVNDSFTVVGSILHRSVISRYQLATKISPTKMAFTSVASSLLW